MPKWHNLLYYTDLAYVNYFYAIMAFLLQKLCQNGTICVRWLIMDNQTVFKDRLIEAIKSKGLTQTKLGELMNVNQATISRWLNGKREPDYQSLIMLCGFLDESPNSLLGYDEKSTHKLAYEALQKSVISDIDFITLRGHMIAWLKNEGKTDEEINAEVERLFKAKFEEYCRYYNFIP